MKRVVALAMGLLLLAGCGVVGAEKPAEPRLISQMADNDISLYYVEEGTVLLRHGNEKATFSGWGKPWLDLYYQPSMTYFDIDGDGLKELAISTQVTRGTTFSENLHIITLEKQPWIDHVFTTDDVSTWFDKRLQYKRGELENTVEVTLEGETWTIQLRKPDFSWAEPSIVSSLYYFGSSDGYTLRARSDVLEGDFPAKVTFDGEQFDIVDTYYLAPNFSGGGYP